MTSWLPPDELRATALSLHDTLLAIFSGHTARRDAASNCRWA